ncbi:MAG: PilZ domain-containing protein [Deltaproteobacteria bacterium]|nr:PilZ domain-containing protein [Deltaproteobacteria bacterium]MCL5277895.1 PilZ domain-containing protein [Deltaproteobacteria bacterium]
MLQIAFWYGIDNGMLPYQNKRRSERIKAKIRINCKGQGIFFSDFTRDIGLHGIGIEAVTLIENGTIVELYFSLPDETEPIVAKGKVIWSDIKRSESGEDNMNVVLGIEFQEIAEVHTNRLFSFIDNNVVKE